MSESNTKLISDSHTALINFNSHHQEIDDIPISVMKWAQKYSIKHKLPCEGLTQYLYSPSDYIVFYPEARTIVRATWSYFMKKKRAYLNNHKIMCIHGFKILVCYR